MIGGFIGKPIGAPIPSGGGGTAVGIDGIAWSQRFEEFKGRKAFTDPPAFALPIVPAVGISGVSWALRLDAAVPKKGRTEPPAYDPQSVPAVGISGVAWSQRFEPFYGKPIRLTTPPAYGIPPVPAVGVQGVSWSQRFEPFLGRPIRFGLAPAYDYKRGPAEISGMAWFTDHDTWRPLRPFDFTSPLGAALGPIWVATPPTEFTGERKPLYRRGQTYWKGRN